jgi:superfamily II DNA/RNA helicase
MSNTKFFTNTAGNSLLDKFKGIFENRKDFKYFDVLVGYFYASGYHLIKEELKAMSKIRILVGIEADKLLKKYHDKGLLYVGQTEEVKAEVLDNILHDIQHSEHSQAVEESMLQFLAEVITGRIEIKAHPSKKLHAKFYIFRPDNYNAHNTGEVIMGSSNLTQNGLGEYANHNYEFNVILKDYTDVKFATDEFERLWAESTPILPEAVREVFDKSFVKPEPNITPYELYIKFLIEYFGQSIHLDEQIFQILPKNYTKLQYQADAIAEGMRKLEQYNGFILADVVGLGKTIVACAIIKKFVLQSPIQTKILVVHPPAVRMAWEKTLKDFQLTPYVTLVTNGSLHKITDRDNLHYPNPEEFGMVIVDESHKFRSHSTQAYELLQLICKTPFVHFNKAIDKKVMLLSATPLNNKPEDIANQIYLFQEARQSTIEGVPNLQSFFSPKIKAFQKVRAKMKEFAQQHPEQKLPAELIGELREIFIEIKERVLRPLVIRRTRKDLENNELYQKDLVQQGIVFPKVPETPTSLTYSFNDQLAELFKETVDYLVADRKDENGVPMGNTLGYYRYRGIQYFVDVANQKKYAKRNQSVEDISDLLSGLMQNRLVKRLESSFFAFKKSLNRLRKQNSYLIQMFEDIGEVFFTQKKFPIELFFEDKDGQMLTGKALQESLAVLRKKIAAYQNSYHEDSEEIAIYKPKDFDEKWLAGLKKDQVLLDALCQKWENITYDPKFEAFCEVLPTQLLGQGNLEKKLVVFTESADTCLYLQQKLKEAKFGKVLAMTSKMKNDAIYKTIRANFDANISSQHAANDYDLLITTDVLAEGINLHRSNTILNYDIPWNTVKLMQRIGRVNRIGSKAPEILVFNFKPVPQSNAKINLNEIALAKLQSFHSSFSEQSKVYSTLEELEENTLQTIATTEEDETDLRLEYLSFLRKFAQEQPENFKRIEQLAVRSRVGRISPVGLPEGTTLAYLRNEYREAFFLKTPAKALRELTFAEAVSYFKAAATEPAYYQVSSGYHDHLKLMESAFMDNSTNDTQQAGNSFRLAPKDGKVVSWLQQFAQAKGITVSQKEILRKLKELIENGVYATLVTKISKIMDNKQLSLPEKLQAILDIGSRYGVQSRIYLDNFRLKNPPPTQIATPEVVLAESFL